MKKLFAIITLVSLGLSTASAYDEIDCSSDSVFSDYSCNQCFEGGKKGAGDSLMFLEDVWVNDTGYGQVIYTEEQNMPVHYNLDEMNTVWSQFPESDEEFWEYTTELDSIYNNEYSGYLLDAGGTVTWLRSTTGAAYTLTENNAPANQNIGMTIYSLAVHNILEGGDVDINTTTHNECVLFKSKAEEVVEISEEPTPEVEAIVKEETGPAQYLLLFLGALLLGALLFRTKKA